MAAKNYARFLPQAVRSVFDQTVADWELVIVDDGSTDATPAAVKPFLSDPRVRYHRSDKLGQPRAKNLGYRLSRGEFIAYLDADDAWEPTKLAKQLTVMRDQPAVGVCHTGRVLMDESGNVGAPLVGARVDGHPQGVPLQALFLNNPVCFSSVMVRRSVFEHVGAFDPQFDLAIDYDLWLRVARHYEFVSIDEPLVRYRTGHGNLSKKLWDRVDTALSIMTRAVRRGGLPNAVVAEGYSSTCVTLGYVMRPSEPRTAMRWYARALAWGGRPVESAKGLAACAVRWLSGKRAGGTAENSTTNR